MGKRKQRELDVVPTDRQVIADQLLTALDDKAKVGILADEEMLEHLINVMELYSAGPIVREYHEKLLSDLSLLHKSAFRK